MRVHLFAPGRHLTGGQKMRLASRAIPGKPQRPRLSKSSRRPIFDPTLTLEERLQVAKFGKNQKIQEQERALEPHQRCCFTASCNICNRKHIIHH